MTPRALLIGLGMIAVLVAMTQALGIKTNAADVAAGAPPPAPIYLLFGYALLLGPALGRVSRRLVLTRAELMLIYALAIIAGPVMHPIGIGFLLPHCAAPAYYREQEPTWATFWPVLAPWLGPREPGAVQAFFRGAPGVPWGAWATPLVAWGAFLAVLSAVMLCLNVLFRHQYVDRERLSFPLTALPLTLADSGSSLPRQPLFWAGLALPILAQLPMRLNEYIPSVPSLPLREVLVLDAGQSLPPPWNGLGEIYFSLIFWLLGVAYLIPKEISLSGVVFYLLALVQNVGAVAYGRADGTPSVYTNDFPALYAQGAGAAFALTGITLWAARPHLRAVMATVFRGPGAIDDRDEFLSYRTAFFGAIGGSAFLLAWLWAAGMRPAIAALLLGLMLAYFFIFARVRAETGLGFGVILWPKMLDEVMVTLVGARNMTLSDLTVLYAMRWLYFTPALGSVMACQLEGFALVDRGGGMARRLGGAFLVGGIVAIALALTMTLWTYVTQGFELLPAGRRGVSMVGSQSYWSYSNLLAAFTGAKGPDAGGIGAMAAGAAVATGLSVLRVQVPGFPLHPAGYLAANSWGMHLNWITFLLGWALKAGVLRYGGLRLYRLWLPGVLGMIVGDMVNQGLWGLVAWATGGAR